MINKIDLAPALGTDYVFPKWLMDRAQQRRYAVLPMGYKGDHGCSLLLEQRVSLVLTWLYSSRQWVMTCGWLIIPSRR